MMLTKITTGTLFCAAIGFLLFSMWRGYQQTGGQPELDHDITTEQERSKYLDDRIELLNEHIREDRGYDTNGQVGPNGGKDSISN